MVSEMSQGESTCENERGSGILSSRRCKLPDTSALCIREVRVQCLQRHRLVLGATGSRRELGSDGCTALSFLPFMLLEIPK